MNFSKKESVCDISPILHIEELHPGYEDHASNVWLIQTKDEEVIVRSSKLDEEPNNDFWWGCKQLFGIDPRSVHNLEIVNHTLGQYTTLPIPKLFDWIRIFIYKNRSCSISKRL